MSRMTDEQIADIVSSLNGKRLHDNHFRCRVQDLLSDREPLLAEIAKLRKVAEAARALEIKPYPAHGSGWIMAIIGPPNGLTALEDAISALEAANVPDATDDKE